jgi:hypothetical protein
VHKAEPRVEAQRDRGEPRLDAGEPVAEVQHRVEGPFGALGTRALGEKRPSCLEDRPVRRHPGRVASREVQRRRDIAAPGIEVDRCG